MSFQNTISETITKLKYCNLDSCYFLFQNDPVLNRLCYFTWHQDLGLDPKSIKVKWESFDSNGICARPMSLCRSDFSPIHTRNLFQWILRFLPLSMGGEFEEQWGERNFKPDWNQILIESSCDTEIILMKWHFRKRL